MRTTSRITPLTPQRRRGRPSPVVIIVLLLILAVGAIYFLSTLESEVPTAPIEVDVTNEAGA